MAWLFPFAEIEKNSVIVLFGAGSVGYEFHCQLKASGFCKDIIWVDSQHEWYGKMGLPVQSPNIIKDASYDKIVIAVDRKETYTSIKDFLLQEGVEESKILWKDNYFYDNKLSVSLNDVKAKESISIRPTSLIDENRLDIIVRYLYAQAILNDEEVEKYKNMYFKLIMAINKGEEPLNNGIYACFSKYDSKKTIEEFDLAFRDLIESMIINDFDKEHYIPLGKDSKPVNGAHRIAAALALGTDVWAVTFPEIEGGKMCYEYNEEWLAINGFEAEEIEDVLDTYVVLTMECF